MNLSKQQVLDADPKSIQQNNFTGNLNQAKSAWMVFILKEVKGTSLNYSQGTMKVL